jgi:hypothetical protein
MYYLKLNQGGVVEKSKPGPPRPEAQDLFDDAGSQRNYRRKKMKCFEHITNYIVECQLTGQLNCR